MGFEPTSTALGSVVSLEGVLDPAIASLYPRCPRVVGRAFTVELEANDNLAFHQAVYEAPPGAVIVAATGGSRAAVAGGNVCAVAQGRGIAGFVIDGFIRDVEEIETLGFPVYARGTCPVPGTKERLGQWVQPVRCGGVVVKTGDLIVADRDGIVVVPAEDEAVVLAKASQRAEAERLLSREAWQAEHQRKTADRIQALSNR